MKSLSSQPKQPYFSTKLNISRDVTITPLKDKGNNIMSMLKNLPDITFDFVQSEPVFKVPKCPKIKEKYHKKIVLEKTVSERQINNTKNMKSIIVNNNFKKPTKIKSIPNSTIKQKQIPLIKDNTNTLIPKTPETVSKSHFISENGNAQKTSSPNKLLKKLPSLNNIKSTNLKTVKPAEEILNVPIVTVKTITDSSITNTTNNTKTKELTKDYMLMDISTDGKINIISTSRPSDLNVTVPDYNNFVLGITNT